jgi:ABC-2 type transport system permease protein
MRTLLLYPALLRAAFAEAVAYRAEFLIWMLTTTMPLVMLALWSAVAAEAPLGRFDEREFVTYFLAMLLVRMLTGSWVVWLLVDEIRRGALAQRLLRPVHPIVAYSAENLAGYPIRALVALPIVVVLLATTGGDRLSGDVGSIALFVLALLGGWLINFLSMMTIACLGFFLESALGVFGLWMAVQSVLSGYLVPIELFPDTVREAAMVLPFRFMLSFPIELLMGQLDAARIATGFLLQWGWITFFAATTAFAWKMGLRRFAAFGG